MNRLELIKKVFNKVVLNSDRAEIEIYDSVSEEKSVISIYVNNDIIDVTYKKYKIISILNVELDDNDIIDFLRDLKDSLASEGIIGFKKHSIFSKLHISNMGKRWQYKSKKYNSEKDKCLFNLRLI